MPPGSWSLFAAPAPPIRPVYDIPPAIVPRRRRRLLRFL